MHKGPMVEAEVNRLAQLPWASNAGQSNLFLRGGGRTCCNEATHVNPFPARPSSCSCMNRALVRRKLLQQLTEAAGRP
jgi:hypothetical protein